MSPVPPVAHPALDAFDPVVARWFAETLGTPTATQQTAWPVIAAGEHTLVSAPTGCGKTLTAFLSCLDRFASGELESGATRVVYISPLKALNNDVRRNLLRPLQELRERFAASNIDSPLSHLRVETRSGDTSGSQRQRLLRHPPEILITTPESLNLMLTTVRGRLALGTVDTVILDEIHAIAGNRRGVQLVTALERIVELSGEFQRIALSATVKPLERIAAFIGGNLGDEPRSVRCIAATEAKSIELRVEAPVEETAETADARDAGEVFWTQLGERLAERVLKQRSTLIFTNTRALAEQLTHHINQAPAANGELLAYAHHGSLAREVRLDVEERLKAGELRAIVATSSLELGIDIGTLDEVLMIQSPASASSCLQRVGRAGHGVGETSRAALIPTFAHDFLAAAALAGAAQQRDIEDIVLLEAPLDVLAQIIVGMAGTETWRLDQMVAVLRRAHPYEKLTDEAFELVLDMLSGRFSSTRIRSLTARLSVDRTEGTAVARKGALMALYNSGGTIPDRGYYKLRHAELGDVMGELDEEFVWEARVGQIFAFGTRAWQIEHITHDDVIARPAAHASAPPFWRADALYRGAHLAAHVGDLLAVADQHLQDREDAALRQRLTTEYACTAAAADSLIDYLAAQRNATRSALPHRSHLLIEHIESGPGGYEAPDGSHQTVLHTFWGGRINYPLSQALRAAWLREYGEAIEVHASDDFIALQTHQRPTGADLLELLSPERLDENLRTALAESNYFGARFREAAGRALLLPKPSFNRRMPLWMNRQKAKEMLQATRRFEDFPITLEAWRTCLRDEFELEPLRDRLQDLASGAIATSERVTERPSPFALNVAWTQITERYMYADDTPSAAAAQPEHFATLVGEVQPRVSTAVAADYGARRARLLSGYAPADRVEILEYVRERIVVSPTEWQQLSAAVADLGDDDAGAALLEAEQKLSQLGGGWRSHPDDQGLIEAAFELDATTSTRPPGRDNTTLLDEWLALRPPLTREAIRLALPADPPWVDTALETLEHEGRLVSGLLIEGSAEIWFCHSEVWPVLLRMQRAARRQSLEAAIETRDRSDVPQMWLALRPGRSDQPEMDLENQLAMLAGWGASPAQWERDLLGSRLAGYRPDLLDRQLLNETITWCGRGNQRISVMRDIDLDVLPPARPDAEVPQLFGATDVRLTFHGLADRSSSDLSDFNDKFWEHVWAGALTSDSLALLRAGEAQKYSLSGNGSGPDPGNAPASARRRMVRLRARQRSRGWPGVLRQIWPVDDSANELAPVEALELARDRARILLRRYGVVCREVLTRESEPFRWKDVFPALRAMELAGEVTVGLFFRNLGGPQFASQNALRLLRNPQWSDRAGGAWWVAANDPHSPLGYVDWPDAAPPQRRTGNWIVCLGPQVIAAIENGGSRLRFFLEPDHPNASAMLTPIEHLLYGEPHHSERIAVQSINGVAPRPGPWLEFLSTRFDVVRDHRSMELRRRQSGL